MKEYIFFEDFLDGIIIVNSENQIVYLNNVATTLLNLKSSKRALNKNIRTQITLVNEESHQFFESLSQPNNDFTFFEVFFRSANSEEVSVAAFAVKLMPNTQDKIIYMRDLSIEINLQDKYSSERKRLQKALVDVETDSLTGGLNKLGLLNKLNLLWDKSGGVSGTFSVVVFDLDGFKKINDTYGHQAGDLYLKELSKALSASLREADSIGRFGGDEFIVILYRTNREGSIAVGKKLLKVVDDLYVKFEESQLHCTASIGICANDESISSAAELLKLADDCSYISKKSGKNAVCVHPDKEPIRN